MELVGKRNKTKSIIAINLKILVIMTNRNELNAPPKIQSLSECIFLSDFVLLIRNI